MNIRKHTVLLAAFALAVGCNDGGPFDGEDTDTTDDTGFIDDSGMDDTDDTGPVDLTPMWNVADLTNGWEDIITADCGNDEVTFMLETINWGYAPELYIADTRFTQDYDELHTFEETDVSPDPSGYSEFTRTLSTGVAFPNTPDATSVFACPTFDPDDSAEFANTFALAVWDEDGATDTSANAPVDCIVFGEDADLLINNPPASLPAVPSWLTAANCTAL